jgi:hypothetical protein
MQSGVLDPTRGNGEQEARYPRDRDLGALGATPADRVGDS